MCLGIPGEIVELMADRDDFALVRVAGVKRVVNVGLLEGERLATGDWILIHVGFALSKIDREEAANTIQMLEGMGQTYTDELTALARSDLSDLSAAAREPQP